MTSVYIVLVDRVCRTGRVLVYGGDDGNGIMLSSVEMLSLDGQGWQTQPTTMFKADSIFASVPLPA